MKKRNSAEILLNDQTKFRLNEINKIKDYFSSEIQERKTMSKKLSKYIAAFDYIDWTLIVLSATSRGISIISFTSVIEIPAGIASASFTLAFSLTTGIIKKLLKVTRNRNKINSIETLMSQALIDLDISHEEFKSIVNEKEKYVQKKESVRNIKNQDELTENSSDIRKNSENKQFQKIFFSFLVYIKWLKLVLRHGIMWY